MLNSFKAGPVFLCLMVKKIVPQSAEVYLLDKEDEPKVSTVKSDYDQKLTYITNFIEKLEAFSSTELQAEDRCDLNQKCQTVIKILGTTNT